MTNTLIDEYLEQAFPLCMELPRQKKHLSFILHKNRIVATGRNFFKTHPKAKVIGYAFDEMHSELDALLVASIKKALKDFIFVDLLGG